MQRPWDVGGQQMLSMLKMKRAGEMTPPCGTPDFH